MFTHSGRSAVRMAKLYRAEEFGHEPRATTPASSAAPGSGRRAS
jgi:hypothetical protein